MAITMNAFRFVHPDVNETQAGLHFGTSGGIALATEEESIRQALLLLLTTIPGERVMRPDYGCDLYRLLFSPNDDTTAGLAIYYVRRAVERWEPRVDVLEVDATRHPEVDNCLNILLSYRIRQSLRMDSLVLPINLEGDTA
jgi:hypothetical protein